MARAPGYTHIYTGNGKGKTTAAMGLVLRALGQGLRVVVVQFLKGGDTGEVHALGQLPGVTLLRNSKAYGFYALQPLDVQAAIRQENMQNLQQAMQLARDGACDLLVLDEALDAYNLNALDTALLDELVMRKPDALELVLTGRDAPPQFLDAARYVSFIQMVKHPFQEGIPARRGVEY